MTETKPEDKPSDQEFQLIAALLSTNFVFLGFLLNIPENTSLFNSTYIKIPFVYSIRLNQSINSNLLLSFFTLCGALLLYFMSRKKQSSFTFYKTILLLGIYYWICLFLNILYLLDLKYLKSASVEIMVLNVIFISVGYALLFVYSLGYFFPGPQFDDCPYFPRLVWYLCYLGYWWVNIKYFTPVTISICSPFIYLWKPYLVFIFLTILSEILVHKIIPRLIKLT